MTAAAPEVATPPGTTRPARRASRIMRSPGAAAGLQALSPAAWSHSTVCLPPPARRTGRRLIPVAGCGEPHTAARDRGSRPRRPAPPSGPAQDAPGRAAARTRRPPIPGCPAAQPETRGKRAGNGACLSSGSGGPGRGDLPEQHDEIIRGPLKHPARHRSPGTGRSSRPSTAPATTTPAAQPSGNPPKALGQPHHRQRRNVLAARTATRQRAGLLTLGHQASPGTSASPVPTCRAWPNSCTPVPACHPARPAPPSSQPPSASSSPARPPWTCLPRPPPTHSRPEPPATDAGRAARHAPERAACLSRFATEPHHARLPEPPLRTPAAARCRTHAGMQITVIRTAARMAITTDRIRICRIARVACSHAYTPECMFIRSFDGRPRLR